MSSDYRAHSDVESDDEDERNQQNNEDINDVELQLNDSADDVSCEE